MAFAQTVFGSTKPPAVGFYDSELEFKDAGAVTVDGAATVDSAAKIVDLGDAHFQGKMVIDATAVEVDSGNESYEIVVELSNSATFASGIFAAASITLGDAAAILGDTDMGAGRYKLMFDNEVLGTYYRYARLYTNVTGTIATGINYSAFCARIL
jgi:hypothetical protein